MGQLPSFISTANHYQGGVKESNGLARPQAAEIVMPPFSKRGRAFITLKRFEIENVNETGIENHAQSLYRQETSHPVSNAT
jgi:hypothetical protein